MSAVDYIHRQGIVHRDLKPGNICHIIFIENILLFNKDDFSTIKVADFGLSAKYNHSSVVRLDQHCGTLIHMAPEVISSNVDYSKYVDMWSIGIIMYQLLSGGKHPLY